MADSLIEGLFAKSKALGLLGFGLAGLVLVAVCVLISREVSVLFKQRAIARLIGVALAHQNDDVGWPSSGCPNWRRSTRTSRRWTRRAAAQELRNEIIDGAARVEIAEKALMPTLGLRGPRGNRQGRQAVSMVTAIAPRAIIDVVFVAAQALRLIWRISEIYGGRLACSAPSGWRGRWPRI